MPRSDVDPLADTLPPRYAYESDDEDETGLSDLQSGKALERPLVEIAIQPPLDEGKEEGYGGVLIVASGAVGGVWARGAGLGEQVGQVNVNKHAIGLVFRPTWTSRAIKGTVLVSEALARLPVWAMNPYAEAILDRWRPSKVILLDAYSSATYISATPVAHHEAPLRYLSTDTNPPSSSTPLSLFAPPNLLQSTTAAFLNLAALSQRKSPKGSSTGLAILAPSRRAPLPTPQNLSRSEADKKDSASVSGITALASLEDAEDWDLALLRETHLAVLHAAGFEGAGEVWNDARGDKKEKEGGLKSLSRRRRIGETEGGMYI